MATEDHPGTQERQPWQKWVRAVDEGVEQQAARRAVWPWRVPAAEQPARVVIGLEGPPLDRRSGDRGERSDGDEPAGAQREQQCAGDEEGAVEEQDRAAPQPFEDEAERVEQEPAPNQRPSIDAAALAVVIEAATVGHQCDSHAGNQHERGREASRQGPGPRVEETVDRGFSDGSTEHDQVAVVVHRGDADERYCA